MGDAVVSSARSSQARHAFSSVERKFEAEFGGAAAGAGGAAGLALAGGSVACACRSWRTARELGVRVQLDDDVAVLRGGEGDRVRRFAVVLLLRVDERVLVAHLSLVVSEDGLCAALGGADAREKADTKKEHNAGMTSDPTSAIVGLHDYAREVPLERHESFGIFLFVARLR